MSDMENRYQQVQYFIDIGRYVEARDRAMQLLAMEPEDPALHMLLSQCYFYEEEYAKALEHCQERLRLANPGAGAYYLLGRIYMAMDAYPEAEQALLQALELNPVGADTMATYAYLMFLTGHQEKAKKLFEEAARLDPEDPLVLHFQFSYFLVKSKRADLRQTLAQYIENGDSQVSKFVMAGLYNLNQDRYREARENFREAYLLEPTNEGILSLLEYTAKLASIWYLPHRLLSKLGGGAVIWVVLIAIITLGKRLGYEELGAIPAFIYIILVLYTYIVAGVERWILRRRR